MLFSNEKEYNVVTCYNIHEPQYEGKKPGWKTACLCYFPLGV